jgi:hypothetical protein
MFQDLDETLRVMLGDAAAPVELRNADVSFDAPNKNFAPTQPTVNLFLYEVKENRVLRDPRPIVTRVGDAFVRRAAPLRVDCTYMVTAWSNQTGATGVAEEHLLLALALAWLSRFPTIPDTFLQGGLVGSQPFPLQTFVAQTEDGKSAGEFWSALGSVPRPAFQLSVTLALALALEEPEGPPVVTRELGTQLLGRPASHETFFAIAGRVTEAGVLPPAPIAGALVTILENGRTATADAEGVFHFLTLEAGNYTLRATAAGFATLDQAINVPALVLNEYDMELTP